MNTDIFIGKFGVGPYIRRSYPIPGGYVKIVPHQEIETLRMNMDVPLSWSNSDFMNHIKSLEPLFSYVSHQRRHMSQIKLGLV